MRRGLRLLPAQLADRLAVGGGADRQYWGLEAEGRTCHVPELLYLYRLASQPAHLTGLRGFSQENMLSNGNKEAKLLLPVA
jgi:hypothetical protein